MTTIKAGDCVVYKLRPSIPLFCSGVALSEHYDTDNGRELQIRTTDKRLDEKFLVYKGSNIMSVPPQLLTGKLSADEFLRQQDLNPPISPEIIRGQIEAVVANFQPIPQNELKSLIMYLGFSE